VDAVVSGARAGTLHIWDGCHARLRNEVFCSSTHAFGLADAIELARVLDRLPNKLTVYGIEATQFATGMPPSRPVLAGVKQAVEHIASHLSPSLGGS
jgi:hydrogenase maturation protease